MNTALLLAGGAGSRIHTDVPKQYLSLGNRMLITCALEPLIYSSRIDAIEIVAEPVWQEAILEDVQGAGLDIGKIAGFSLPGVTRQHSIGNGIHSILKWHDAADADTLLIHDAARPFLTEQLLEACFVALPGHDGVMPVLPMKDTVYESGDGTHVSGLPVRSHLYAGQAPELFLLKKYDCANRALSQEELHRVCGSAQPAVMAGLDIVMIPGDENNVKITTEADLRKYMEW